MKILQIILTYFLLKIVKCDYKEDVKSKNPLPYFRRQVEKITSTLTADDFSNNLVSILVDNVKEIFDEIVDTSDPYVLHPTSVYINNEEDVTPKLTDNDMKFENFSLSPLIDHNFDESITSTNKGEMTERFALMQLSKQVKSLEKAEYTFKDFPSKPYVSNVQMLDASSDVSNEPDTKRSCILCNNVISEDCSDPKNKLIAAIVCKGEGDLCYSQHTPFGVIDRGCFNVNRNLTTYVCSCNLCNYISISEMPYIFSNIQDWVNNVIELSRTRNFRKSVFKEMSCLRCEVNTTNKRGDMLDSANCLEGNIGALPTQVCADNEICAVRAIRSDGYVWRGCVRAPLYNYWWALCDNDLCNYDSLVSIYDFVGV